MWKTLISLAITVAKKYPKEALTISKKIYSNTKAWWQGKCIAIIGPTASGKNSLFAKLKGESPPNHHIQTRGAESEKTFDFKWTLPDKSIIKFKCKNSINVGGEIDSRERFWLDACKDSDVIFYMIDAEKLITNSKTQLKRIEEDFQWITSSIEQFKKNPNIHILINKVDLIVKSRGLEKNSEAIEAEIGPYIDSLEQSAKRIFHNFHTRLTGVNPISMTDPYLFKIYFNQTLESIATLKRT